MSLLVEFDDGTVRDIDGDDVLDWILLCPGDDCPFRKTCLFYDIVAKDVSQDMVNGLFGVAYFNDPPWNGDWNNPHCDDYAEI